MAETKKGKKFVRIEKYSYTRDDGTKVTVPTHDRSTPRTSTGPAPARKKGK